jgi:hypothetical protein
VTAKRWLEIVIYNDLLTRVNEVATNLGLGRPRKLVIDIFGRGSLIGPFEVGTE